MAAVCVARTPDRNDCRCNLPNVTDIASIDWRIEGRDRQQKENHMARTVSHHFVASQLIRCLSVILILLWTVAPAGKTTTASERDTTKRPRSSRYALSMHTHTGICDASGVVALDEKLIAVAGDEYNQILVFDVGRSGQASYSIDVSRFLNVDAKHPEVDFEGGARVDDTIYWISSHGRNRKGKKRDSRYRFFATKIKRYENRIQLEPQGIASNRLINELIDDPRYAKFRLKEASKRAPKSKGALNIEGITDTPDGHLLIGFRNPVPDGKALIATLLNPEGVIAGQSATFAGPITLDLGGNGIRGMASSGQNYLIIAGPIDSGGTLMLYRWKGPGNGLTRISDIDFGDLNPEAVTFLPSSPPRVLLLSDDGTREVDGQACKDLMDQNRKRFRSLVIEPRRQPVEK